jgi:hypothetical protein
MLIVVFALALPFAMHDTPERHVRTTERSILALINAGIDRSATFRDLIAPLNASDVIVYVEPKVTRPRLRGYLAHQIVARDDHRYLRIAINTGGSPQDRLIRLIAHELQHAVEVAQMPEARDEASLRLALARLAVPYRCNGVCVETQKAMDVERVVSQELKMNRAEGRPAPPTYGTNRAIESVRWVPHRR